MKAIFCNKSSLAIWLLVILALSCQSKTKRKWGENYVVGEIVNDTLLNGKISFFDPTNTLISTREYDMGVPNGESITYYRNGKVKVKNYSLQGVENGYRYNLDSLGRLSDISYIQLGRQFGPEVTYDNNKIRQYVFTAFSGQVMAFCSYDSNENVVAYRNYDLFVNVSDTPFQKRNKFEIFLYTPRIPQFKSVYKICSVDSNKTTSVLLTVPESSIYFQTYLDSPHINTHYAVSLEYYDAKTKKNTIAYREVILGSRDAPYFK